MQSAPSSSQLRYSELNVWHERIDQRLQENRPHDALRLIRVVLRHLPRHLATYRQLLRACWLLRRWSAGKDWALRLLRADPSQELVWIVLANAAEEEEDPAQAQRYWRHAFDQAPYNRQVRAGIVRTTLGRSVNLQLTRPALATLYRLGRHWDRAAHLYWELLADEPHRLDLQTGLLESLWQIGDTEEALHLARHLVQQESNLLLGWLVSLQMGDADDRALAQAPLSALDPDGIYAAHRYRVPKSTALPFRLPTSVADVQLLNETSPPN